MLQNRAKKVSNTLPCHCSLHSIGNDSRATLHHAQYTKLPWPVKIKLPKTNKKTNIGLSRWPALGCCLLLAGVPHCHLFITSLSQPDSSNPVDTRASAEVALAISAYHKTFSFPRPPLKYQGSWERESETAEAWTACHFLPRFHWGDTEMSDTGWQLEHMKSSSTDKPCHL